MNQTHVDGIVKQVVADFESQKPIAIIRFGSSTERDEFVPGVSNLDFLVISDHPICQKKYGIELEVTYATLDETAEELIKGHALVLNAINTGIAMYDPRSIVRLLQKPENLAQTKPSTCKFIPSTEYTEQTILQRAADHLSSAINRYFSEKESINALPQVLRNIHSVTKGIGIFYVYSNESLLVGDNYTLKWRLQDCHQQLLETLEKIKRQTMRASEQILAGSAFPAIRKSKTKIKKDELGTLILEAEQHFVAETNGAAYCEPLNTLVSRANEHIGRVLQIYCVRFDCQRAEQRILAGTDEGNFLFGIRNTTSTSDEFYRKISDSDFVKAYADTFIVR